MQVVVSGVRVGPYQNGHAELAAAGDKFTQNIAAAEPCAAVVKGDIGGIVRYTASAAEADTFRASSLEVVANGIPSKAVSITIN